MMAPLSERTALVTGGGRGIGRGIALALAHHGAKVAIMSRTSQEIDQVAAEIIAQDSQALAITGDVANWDSVNEVITQTVTELGPIDILINNAGIIGPLDSFSHLDPDAWVRVQEINLHGAFYAMRVVLPGMLERGWGRVLNISSGAAKGSGILRGSAYSVSKAAMDMLSRSAGAEIDGSGVTVNSVYPGTVDTAMQTEIRETPPEQLGEVTAARFRDYHEGGKLTDPLDVGRLITAMLFTDKNAEVLDVRILAAELRAILAAL